MRMCTPVSLMNSSLYSRRKGNFLFMASRSVPRRVVVDDAGSLAVVGCLDLMVSSLIVSLAEVRFEDRSSSSSTVGRPKYRNYLTWWKSYQRFSASGLPLVLCTAGMLRTSSGPTP